MVMSGIVPSTAWTTDGALRVGGAIAPPKKIKHVPPLYPPIAQSARVAGVVIIEARLDADGHVSQARIVKSIPLLDQAALDAVRQWEFTPTLLNGVATPVIMTLAVNFVLDGGPAAQVPNTVAADTAPLSEGAVRIGGDIKPPKKLRHVPPVYPADAQANHVTGVVIIQARIEADGTVSRTLVLKSVPGLDEAAVEAVRQWVFEPTLLNGQPTPVVMTVTVNFTLE
jgi:protein TonB